MTFFNSTDYKKVGKMTCTALKIRKNGYVHSIFSVRET